MRTFAKYGMAVALLVVVAAPARAQVPGVEFKLNPRIGLYAPLSSDLGDYSGETLEMQSSFAVGLGAELQLPALPFGIRANLDYATSTAVDTENGIGGEAPNATLLAVVGDLVFRPLPSLVVVEPYFFAGGGLKQYDFDTSSAADFSEDSDPTIHLGGGLDFGLGPFGFNAELSDYISWFEIVNGGGDTQMQHDVFLTAGFSIGLL